MGRLGKCELFNHFVGEILVDYDSTPTAFLGWVRRNVLRLYTPAAFWVGETQCIASVRAPAAFWVREMQCIACVHFHISF